MSEGVHHCVVCRAPVRGPAEGTAFGVRGRLLFVACHAHVPIVHAGAKVTSKIAARGIEAFLQRKAPMLWDMINELRKQRKELEA